MVNFGPILQNHLNMFKTMIWGALLVATDPLNTFIKVLSKLDKNWLSCEQNTIFPYLDKRTKYDRFQPINWATIKLHILCEYQLNTYLTVDSVVK